MAQNKKPSSSRDLAAFGNSIGYEFANGETSKGKWNSERKQVEVGSECGVKEERYPTSMLIMSLVRPDGT